MKYLVALLPALLPALLLAACSSDGYRAQSYASASIDSPDSRTAKQLGCRDMNRCGPQGPGVY
jgi:hypothetical protein